MAAVRSCGAVILLGLLIALPGAQAPAPVTGVVFEDANGNARRDAGERGLGGVAVSNQHEVVTTAQDGMYTLPRAGFGVIFVSVPDGYRTVGSFWRTVPMSGVGEPADFALRPHPSTRDARSGQVRQTATLRRGRAGRPERAPYN